MRSLLRGKRFSAIGILSINGILDTYITPHTLNAVQFKVFEDFSDI